MRCYGPKTREVTMFFNFSLILRAKIDEKEGKNSKKNSKKKTESSTSTSPLRACSRPSSSTAASSPSPRRSWTF